ncbi:MAG: hypothetical protein SCM11_18310, partial [Bacillota bacterium]|nr:hypothetical protein [Bacillota bacterium]
VNPSIEMDLNRSLAVINVRAMNQDAARLLTGQDFDGMNWEEAVMHWTEVVNDHNPIQQRTVLLSAVMPEGAEQLRVRLLALEEKLKAGELKQAQIRVVYSHDAGVTKTAKKNGLSIGRQMLLNQSEFKQKGWDADTIEAAPLGELVQNLLFGENQDQTGLTRATNAQSLTQTLHSGDPSSTGTTSRETSRETNRETTGSQQTSSGTMQTSRETNRETNRETTGTLSPEPTGSQATSRETSRETSQASQTDPSGSTMTSQNGETNSSATSGSTATGQTSGKSQG